LKVPGNEVYQGTEDPGNVTSSNESSTYAKSYKSSAIQMQ